MSIGSRDVPVFAAPDVGRRVQIWLRSFRLKFLPQGVLPVVLGTIIAWQETASFFAIGFVLALIGSGCVQIGLTMLNDALDYVYGTDGSSSRDKNPFTGGSGVLVDGLVQPRNMLIAVAALYLMAALIGAYLTIQVGTGVFFVALIGFFLSVFYSVKPLRFAYRGLGEAAMFAGYGPTLTLGAYYVQTARFSPSAAFAGVIPGLLMWSMIIVNEIPDYAEDRRAQKMNLTVRLGPARARWLHILGLCGVYLGILVGVAAGALPNWALLALGSLPYALVSMRTTYRSYRDPRGMVPANLAMVLTYSTTMLLLCLGIALGASQ